MIFLLLFPKKEDKSTSRQDKMGNTGSHDLEEVEEKQKRNSNTSKAEEVMIRKRAEGMGREGGVGSPPALLSLLLLSIEGIITHLLSWPS